jgi:hypothetical protein
LTDEEGPQALLTKTTDPGIDGAAFAPPEQPFAGHLGDGDTVGHFQEGGGALPFVRLLRGIPAAHQYSSLLCGESE